jgi:hypothetical protein
LLAHLDYVSESGTYNPVLEMFQSSTAGKYVHRACRRTKVKHQTIRSALKLSIFSLLILLMEFPWIVPALLHQVSLRQMYKAIQAPVGKVGLTPCVQNDAFLPVDPPFLLVKQDVFKYLYLCTTTSSLSLVSAFEVWTLQWVNGIPPLDEYITKSWILSVMA